MPLLLDEILEETFVSLADDECETDICKNIEKFILSGKRPLEIVSNYFMQADRAVIDGNSFIIFVKEKQWIFPNNNFVFASFLSKIVAPSLQKLSIDLSTESDILDNLLVNGLSEIQIIGEIHEKYLDQMHSLLTLNNVEFRRSKIRFKKINASLLELLTLTPFFQDLILIKSAKTEFSTTIDFHEMSKENIQKFVLQLYYNITLLNILSIIIPNVQDLNLRGRFFSPDLNYESLKHFNTNIFTIFPNLHKTSVCYTTIHSSWKEIFDIMNTLTDDIFDEIGTNAIGQIRFEYSEWNVLLSDVIDDVNEEAKVEIEKTDSILKRIIRINENLCFNFSLYFRKSERRRRRFK